MCKGCVYVPEPPHVELDATGATITYRSGDETYVRRCSRSVWRRMLEIELQRLNEFERQEIIARVYEFRQREH
jgi:hypothetical protein